jgi:hypothetical protein
MSSITMSTNPFEVSLRAYPGMLPNQILVSMTDLITSVSLQPPKGGGMKGMTTTPLIAPVNLLFALMQADE